MTHKRAECRLVHPHVAAHFVERKLTGIIAVAVYPYLFHASLGSGK